MVVELNRISLYIFLNYHKCNLSMQVNIIVSHIKSSKHYLCLQQGLVETVVCLTNLENPRELQLFNKDLSCGRYANLVVLLRLTNNNTSSTIVISVLRHLLSTHFNSTVCTTCNSKETSI